MIPDDVLALWRGNGSQPRNSFRIRAARPPGKIPQTIWWYVLLLAFAAAISESALASRYLGTQRDE